MSTSAAIICPECHTTLRPAKPLRPGKSVKCPKCGAGFVVGGDEPAQSPPRAKPPSPVQKKPKHQETPVAAVMPVDDDDEDGGGGTYSFHASEKEEGPNISYAPDMSIRDLRGPAVTAIIDPSNKLIIVGVLGFLGWIAFLVVLLIPLLFPLQTKEERQKALEARIREAELKRVVKPGIPLEPIKIEDDPSFFAVGSVDFRSVGEMSTVLAILCLLPPVLGMIYSAILCMGAVKIQNLESRDWGVISSIMAMVPINAGGMICFLAMVLNMALDFLFDGDFKYIVLGFFLVCYWGLNLAVGIWMLTVLNKPEVIAGFEYVPE
jgi:hypothetical protein